MTTYGKYRAPNLHTRSQLMLIPKKYLIGMILQLEKTLFEIYKSKLPRLKTKKRKALPRRKTKRKFSRKQLAAQRLFAKRARAGTLRKRRRR